MRALRWVDLTVFQSYLSPGLTNLFFKRKALPKELIFGSNLFLKGLMFQSYLSPGLTEFLEAVHKEEQGFQSYLSPGLTSDRRTPQILI